MKPNDASWTASTAVVYSHPVRAVIDDTQPGWRSLTEADFTKVNSADDTWSWKDGVLQCTGKPVSVLRTQTPFRNFELVVEWMHEKPGGNSGVFVWTTPDSIERLTAAGKPGLPQGIEVQLRHGDAGNFHLFGETLLNSMDEKAGKRFSDNVESKAGDWNTMEVECADDTITVALNGWCSILHVEWPCRIKVF